MTKNSSNNGARPQADQATQAPPEAPEGSSPFGECPSRMAMFLEILGAMGGVADASDYSYNWINAFCEAHEGCDPDTFNAAIDAGYVYWSHDSDSDCSTIRLTSEGRAAIATEAGTATTVQQGVVHEGAGPQDIAQEQQP